MKNFKKIFRFLNQHTSDYYHAEFRRNRTTFIFWPQKPNLGVKKQKFSDFNEIRRGNSLKYAD